MDHGRKGQDPQEQNPQQTAFTDPSDRTSLIQSDPEATTYIVDASDQTLQFQSGVESAAPGFSFGRYRNLKFIGQGAMAKVYKADDPSLGRTVALKLIRGDDPHLVKRLMMEAHSHAKVEHKHVCKIYEAGEAEGKPYIAMQYINGKTLKEIMQQLNTEEKVKLIKEVADAIHATHRVGIIHRDLKPSNILVERSEDGEWIPYVMDFGIARGLQSAGLTMTGMVVGTPWYMSPEQALGRTKEVDRRSDVYSLGATLYELLAEALPFDSSESSADALAKVVRDEPIRLRKRNPSIPIDLETIVMKCLEKDPVRRYDSARALAEELGRFLEGEAILARPTGMFSRIYKKAQKHKTVAVILSVAALLIILSAAFAVNMWRTSQQQAFLAQQFGQEVTKMEQTMRIGRLRPLHDTTREKEKVREMMKQIEEQMMRFGKAGNGPGHYAIGRAYLSLEDYEKGRNHLQQSWDSGYREPAVAFSLGLALGELYRKQLVEVERIRLPARQDAERKKIEAAYRTPALNYLSQGARSGSEVPQYVEALIAFYEQDWTNALAKSKEARAKDPELYEIDLLEGELYLYRGAKERGLGNYKEADRYFTLARERFFEAAQIARSDARAYDGMCKTDYQILYMNFYSGGGDLQPQFENANAACSDALKADPQRSDVLASQLGIHWLHGEFLRRNGKDPIAEFNEGIHFGKAALRIDPKNGRAYSMLGNVYINLGDYERGRGGDPVPHYQDAIRNYRNATKHLLEPDIGYSQVGNALSALAGFEMSRGDDPTSKMLEAIQSYETALKMNPTSGSTYNNLGLTYYDLGYFEWKKGKDPTGWLKKSENAYREAIRCDPNLAYPYNNVGYTLLGQAEYAVKTEKDPQKIIEAALESFEQARKKNPEYAEAYWNAANAYRLLNEFALGNGNKPSHTEEIELLLDKSEELRPDIAVIHLERGLVYLQSARHAFAQGNSPEKDLERARLYINRGLSIDPSDNYGYLALAKCWKLKAKWKHRKKQDFTSEFNQGMAVTDKVLATDPTLSDTYLIRGVLLTLKASDESDPVRRKIAYDLAANEFQKGIAIDAYIPPEVKPYFVESKSNAQ